MRPADDAGEVESLARKIRLGAALQPDPPHPPFRDLEPSAPHELADLAAQLRAGTLTRVNVRFSYEQAAASAELPPEVETALVDYLVDELKAPLLAAFTSDPNFITQTIFSDQQWCQLFDKDYLDLSTMRCRSGSSIKGRLLRLFPPWLRQLLFGRVGEAPIEDISIEDLRRIIDSQDTQLARKLYPLPVLPRHFDARWLVGHSLHPSVASLVNKSVFKYPPDNHHGKEFNNQCIAHFAKLLVSSRCVDQLSIVWNATLGDGHPVKLPGGCVVTTSPPECHFPGTEDRVICLRAQQQAEVIDRAKEVVQAAVQVATDQRAGIRIAVPRRVVGTVIGRGGTHIQNLRQSTNATIHISPLFVTSEYASSERVISVSASTRDADSLQNATISLLAMINKHPERASCQRTVYKKVQKPKVERSGECFEPYASLIDFFRDESAPPIKEEDEEAQGLRLLATAFPHLEKYH